MTNQEFTLKVIEYGFDAIKICIWPIAIIILIYWFKTEIKSFFKSLKSIKFQAVGQTFEANTESPAIVDLAPPSELLSKNEVNPAETIESEKEEESWIGLVETELKSNDVDKADIIFDNHIATVNEESVKQDHRAMYLYFKIKFNNSSTAIDEFEKLIEKEKSDDIKFDMSFWFDGALRISKQYKKLLSFYTDLLKTINSELIKTKITSRMSELYILEQDTTSAESLVKKRLSLVRLDQEKSILYKSLSTIEKQKGNLRLSVLLLDKSLEFNPSDEDALFQSAYVGNDNGLKFISISNYDTLTNVNPNHDVALNNLAVSADNSGVKYISSLLYKKAIEKKSSLAMVNKGYKFVTEGLLEEAEASAKEALEQVKPHPNVYELMKEINTTKVNEKKKWGDITKTSFLLQRFARKYVDRYYESLDGNLFLGEWITSNGIPVSLNYDKNSNSLNLNWIFTNNILTKTERKCTITGKFTNSCFEGMFTEKNADGSVSHSLLGPAEKEISCLGYISDSKTEFTIFSLNPLEEFTSVFKKTAINTQL